MQEHGLSIVAFGDSVTLVEDPALNIGTGYVPFLEEIVKQKDITVLGKGYPFRTTDYLKKMFEKDVIQNKPDAVVICAGGNDWSNKAMEIYHRYLREIGSKDKDLLPVEYLQDLNENPFENTVETAFQNLCFMYERAQQNDIFPIAVSVPPVLSRLPVDFIMFPIISLNSKIEGYCNDKNIPFVDIYPRLLDPVTGLKRADYSLKIGGILDPNHYNRKGNKLIARAIYEEGITKIPVKTEIPVKELSLVN